MKATDWAYLAGIIDGEGCIHGRFTKGCNRNYSIRIAIVMRDRPVIDWLEKTFPVGYRWYGKNTNNGGDRFAWGVSKKKDVQWLLRQVYPYLVLKRAQANVAYKMLSGIPLERQHELDQELRRLKRAA